MKVPPVVTVTPSQGCWPQYLADRLGLAVPSQFSAIGNPEILSAHKVGLFCSVLCPSDAALAAYDAARKLCEQGATVISGFHSPVEKECLRILLRGKQPIIVCPARAIARMRIPAEWRPALEADRLLLLSRFERSPRRADTGSARRRNEFVAALSDKDLIIHAAPGGQIEQISQLADRWGITRMKLQD